MKYQIDAQSDKHHNGEDVEHGRSDIVGHEGGFHAAVFEDGADDTCGGKMVSPSKRADWYCLVKVPKSLMKMELSFNRAFMM